MSLAGSIVAALSPGSDASSPVIGSPGAGSQDPLTSVLHRCQYFWWVSSFQIRLDSLESATHPNAEESASGRKGRREKERERNSAGIDDTSARKILFELTVATRPALNPRIDLNFHPESTAGHFNPVFPIASNQNRPSRVEIYDDLEVNLRHKLSSRLFKLSSFSSSFSCLFFLPLFITLCEPLKSRGVTWWSVSPPLPPPPSIASLFRPPSLPLSPFLFSRVSFDTSEFSNLH